MKTLLYGLCVALLGVIAATLVILCALITALLQTQLTIDRHTATPAHEEILRVELRPRETPLDFRIFGPEVDKAPPAP